MWWATHTLSFSCCRRRRRRDGERCTYCVWGGGLACTRQERQMMVRVLPPWPDPPSSCAAHRILGLKCALACASCDGAPGSAVAPCQVLFCFLALLCLLSGCEAHHIAQRDNGCSPGVQRENDGSAERTESICCVNWCRVGDRCVCCNTEIRPAERESPDVCPSSSSGGGSASPWKSPSRGAAAMGAAGLRLSRAAPPRADGVPTRRPRTGSQSAPTHSSATGARADGCNSSRSSRRSRVSALGAKSFTRDGRDVQHCEHTGSRRASGSRLSGSR